MKISSEDEAKKFVASILPEPGIKQKCLMVFADAIDEAHLCGRDRWAIRYTTDKLRLHVDHVSICTLRDRPEHGPIWMALDKGLLGTSNYRSLLERSSDWEWDVDSQWPEYSSIDSKNGYYSPSEKRAEIWPTIRRLHFESINKAANHRALDPRTQKAHSSEILEYLRHELGRHLPDPLY
jgi:hypothetical protein